jgi:hypothetical protein
LAAGIYTAALLNFRRGGEIASPLDLALALDLVLTVPLLAYLLPVRRAGWPNIVVPVRASGPYGFGREARWIALGVDEAGELAVSLSPR